MIIIIIILIKRNVCLLIEKTNDYQMINTRIEEMSKQYSGIFSTFYFTSLLYEMTFLRALYIDVKFKWSLICK
jgi:hypothetical protein